MNLNEIVNILIEFRDKRDWKKFHTPKNLAISVAIEVGELLENFQWKNDNEIYDLLKSSKYSAMIGDEIADVLIYLLLLANECGINVEKAIMEKMKRNEEKYPV